MKGKDQHLTTSHLLGDLKGRSIRGAAATFTGQSSKFVLQLGSTMVLARLLTPEDFGLIAIVAALNGFLLLFKDLGLSMATVQREAVSHAEVSTLFWINAGLGVFFTLLTAALAPVFAFVFDEPRLIDITLALSVAFIFAGLTAQHQALLQRQMRFWTLAGVDLAALAIGIGAAIVCALAGQGYWALVWMQLATAVATAAGVWLTCGWTPGGPARSSGVSLLLKFGGYLSAFNFLNYFARNMDNLLIGRSVGVEQLGLYSRAYALLLLPVGQITAPLTAVTVPALSRLQNDPERFCNYYLRALKTVAYLSMPFVVSLAALSEEVIGLALGEKWFAAAPLFQVLAIAAFWNPVGATVGWLYVSLGQTKRMFVYGCIAVPLTVLSFVVGLPWGAFGVAVAYSCVATLLIIPQFWYAVRRSSVRIQSVLISLTNPLLLSFVIGMAIFLARPHLTPFGPLLTMLGSLSVGAVAALVVGGLVSPMRRDFVQMLDLFARSANKAPPKFENAKSQE